MVLGLSLWLELPSQLAATGRAKAADSDARLKAAYRFERAGWVYVHLEGLPGEIGYQHGYLLAPEIEKAARSVKLVIEHNTKRDWAFYRKASREMLWPKTDAEYQAEIEGIAEGLRARGVNLDVDDVVALNAFQELPYYYVPWLNAKEKAGQAPKISAPDHCSAFVATGSYTRDGQIVMAHNAWTSYLEGQHWRIIFDIVPTKGYHILMDGYPGVIASDDDFGVNAAGLLVTETTIGGFHGWNPDGRPEFVRARQAMQYAASIDDYVRIMLDGNNGGYANDWLLADLKTGEIALFALGLKNHSVRKSRDGYFVGSNFPSDPKVQAEETNFDPNNAESSQNARRARWEQLMRENKGKIDVRMAESFESDHFDVILKKESPDERTLCGHKDLSPRKGPGEDSLAYSPAGATQGKAMDARMAKSLSFRARFGHPCGKDFLAAPFFKAHPDFSWQAGELGDLIAGPWTLFQTRERE